MSESSEPAIVIRDVGKMYKVFSSRWENFLDAMGVTRFTPWRRRSYREFWALRNVNVEIPRGKRLGIIGCNGAGKTTLLKLITGNLQPTEGTLRVNGHVHALMSTGAGFHPEFTGRENIEASLIYQGLAPGEIRQAIDDIAEFTELGEFLDQPFKTYSAGMQARLTFTTATTLTPDILIVDEILGAGDGYFIAKSTERITRLVEETGATVLLVSHALDQTVRFCEEAIWLDRGRIVQRGPTLEVVKAYEQFLRVRNERRLKAKNRLKSGRAAQAAQQGLYSTSLQMRIIVEGGSEAACDVAEIVMREDGEIQEKVTVGGAQDSERSAPASVVLDEGQDWSAPRLDDEMHYRSVCVNGSNAHTASAAAIFHLWGFYSDSKYAVDVTYRAANADAVHLEIWKDGSCIGREALPSGSPEWTTHAVSVTAPAETDERAGDELNAASPHRAIRRWPSNGKVRIDHVTVCGPNAQEQSVFAFGQPMTIRVSLSAHRAGSYPVLPAITIFRLDGVLVNRMLDREPLTMVFADGKPQTITLNVPELNLGEGRYVFSAALFATEVSEQQRYDLIDRAYEFEVVAAEHRLKGAVFYLPGTWSMEDRC